MYLSMSDWPMWPNMYGIAYSQGDEAREYRMKAQIADLKDRRKMIDEVIAKLETKLSDK